MQQQVRVGAELVPGGTRFTLYARHAQGVDVCLFEATDGPESHRLALTSNGNGIWTGVANGVGAGQLYGFRVHGPFEPANGHRFNPAKVLVDPRALAVTHEPPLDAVFSGACAEDDRRPDPRDSGVLAPKSVVVDRDFDWAGDEAPATPWEETILYEAHVRGMSMRHPEVPESLRGTYLGLASEPILDHLSTLGITAIELLPVHQIASEEHLLGHGLHNYFGYSPLGLFAPHAGYATDALGGQVDEFKRMVRAVHDRGFEVILDVVFNHTAEGDHLGRTLSLRGIDNRTYYRLKPDGRRLYLDSTGCGNTLAVNEPAVTDLLIDCLRYWTEEMHVDGFRFDLAVSLGRTAAGFSAEAPFFRAIADDPVLSRVKLIAEPWDLGPDGYQRGQFPTGWLEWDDRFRDTTRRIWKGDAVDAAARSRVFLGAIANGPAGEPEPGAIHFVTCHDGFTLEDLVSYEQKHNWENREQNRDGHDHNLSRNWGVEGPTESAAIRALRLQAKRNLMATLLLADGVPMLLHGDEMDRSQRGNNNAYCQDGDLTWVDWSRVDESEMLPFVIDVVRLRSRLAPMRRSSTVRRSWLRADGRPADPPASEDSGQGSGEILGLFSNGPDGIFLVLPNPRDSAHHFLLPQPGSGHWTRVLSTVDPGCRKVAHNALRVPPHSITVLESRPSASR